MEQMYQDYKDIAEFFIVYISEAHAEDGRRPVPYAKELGIKEHKTYGERCSVANRLTKDKKLSIPCLIDDMDDTVDGMYHGHPDRIFLIRKDGKLGVAGKRGPFGFKPALDNTQDWLAEYKRTGTEPEIAIPADEYDVGEAQGELSIVYERGDYDKALKIAKKISEAEPKSSAHMYNVACMYCLVGSQDKGIEWLEKTVNAGWEDAEQMLDDEDFKSIRETDEFKGLVEGARQNVRDRQARRVTPDAAKLAVGRWTMKTMMRDREFESGMAIRFDDGFLVGTWTTSRGDDVEMEKLTLKGDKLTFERTMMRDMVFKYEGTIDGDEIDGQFTGEMGTLDSNGKRVGTDPKAPIEKDEAEAAKIDPFLSERLRLGI